MARALNILTPRKVASLKAPGRHSDGGGLYLRVTPAGGRSWVFMSSSGGKRVEIGMGAETSVTLATARKLAAEMRECIATGSDPRSVVAPKKRLAEAEVVTFGAFAESYISDVEDGWKNPVHRQQWRSSLRDHAKALNNKPIADIATDDVLEVLRPIWMRLPETASRVRGRIEKVLAAAKARGLRPKDAANPAQLRGHIDVLLPKQQKLKRGHHAALEFSRAPTFMAELRSKSTVVAQCLEFTILTAARSGEALGAKWSEIDFSQKLWRIPGERMKAGVEHVVPLPSSAVDILEALVPAESSPTGPIFAVRGAIRSNMAMSMMLRRMDFGHITVHGFRSTFRDWAGDATNYPRELVEAALAHTIQSKAERAYRRGTAIERRRALMEEWASFLSGPKAAADEQAEPAKSPEPPLN